MKIFYIWIGVISVISVIVTVIDKTSAVLSTGKRIRERTLFLIGALGGAAAMFLTMKLIRHKTRHKSFMIGLPLVVFFQVLLCALFLYYLKGM